MGKLVKESLFEFAEFASVMEDPNLIKTDKSQSIVDLSRLNESIASVLNAQIKNELNSSQAYRAMSCWLDDNKWPAGTDLFCKYADEELTHMSKIYHYLFDRNCKAVVPVCDPQNQEFKDIRDLVEAALAHEIGVTSQWEEISSLAKEEGDNTTYEFAQWFLKEQVEEEDKFRTMLEKMDLDMPLYEIDKLFAEFAIK